MADREQLERSEAAILDVFNNQFPVFTNQVIDNLHRLSAASERWPIVLLILLGALLLVFTILMKIEYFGGVRIATLTPEEFITLIAASAVLMLAGSVFSLYQARGWRKIIQLQQAVGIEILHKQIDIEKDLIMGHRGPQAGALILLPAKIRKRLRR